MLLNVVLVLCVKYFWSGGFWVWLLVVLVYCGFLLTALWCGCVGVVFVVGCWCFRCLWVIAGR